jgi:SAM-dependent methyltransferase
MDDTTPAENPQAALWNGTSGRAWVDTRDVLDGMFQPFADLLAAEVSARDPKHLLDVGCGTGSTTFAYARLLAGKGTCLGVDISEPMIADARARAEAGGVPASFIVADAQRYPFEPDAFDMMVSRLGVMFFDDPARAFANLRSAAKPGAALRFIAWRSGAENPFMTTAEHAAAPFLPNIPPRKPDAPGQFAFADRGRVERILQESGWAGIEIQPIDVLCTLREPDLRRYISRVGPVGQVLHEADEATRAEVIETVLAAFAPFVRGDEVRFTAACWMVIATA